MCEKQESTSNETHQTLVEEHPTRKDRYLTGVNVAIELGL